jgi:hypothetical protein
MVLMEIINGSSTLIFPGQAKILEALDSSKLSRVREPVTRSKSGVQMQDCRHGLRALAARRIAKRTEGVSTHRGHSAFARVARTTVLD